MSDNEPQASENNGLFAGNFVVVAAVVLFAMGFPAADVLLEDWGVFALISVRNSLGLVPILILWVVLEGKSTLRTRYWLKGILIGGFGFGAGSALLLFAQKYTGAVTASLAVATMPLAAVTLEVLLDGRKLTPWFILGVCLVLYGGFLATGLTLSDAQLGIGAGLGMISTFVFAWGSRAAVKNIHEMSPLGKTVVTTTGMMLFNVTILGILLVLGLPGTHMGELHTQTWGLLAVYILLSLSISQTLWIIGVGRIGIGLASFHLNATPFYVMLILVFYGGAWNWQQAIGAAILATGVVLSQKRRAGSKRKAGQRVKLP